MRHPSPIAVSRLLALATLLAACLSSLTLQAEPATDEEQAYQAMKARWEAMSRRTGKVDLPGGKASLDVPNGFVYLGPEDTAVVLSEIWGNPPGEDQYLGMIFPAQLTPFDDHAWAVTIDYEEEGYVKDEDASEINYSDLLKEMQSDTAAASEERVKQGYSSVSLVGWAETPHYDKAHKKLYWAKEIAFGDDPDHTLNYNIRVLGRQGVLVLNFIAGMNQLPDIQQHLEPVLAMASFNEGHRYDQFNPEIDKVAAYGLGGLIAGKVLAKTGLLAAALVFFKKFGVIALLAIGSLFKRLFGKK